MSPASPAPSTLCISYPSRSSTCTPGNVSEGACFCLCNSHVDAHTPFQWHFFLPVPIIVPGCNLHFSSHVEHSFCWYIACVVHGNNKSACQFPLPCVPAHMPLSSEVGTRCVPDLLCPFSRFHLFRSERATAPSPGSHFQLHVMQLKFNKDSDRLNPIPRNS